MTRRGVPWGRGLTQHPKQGVGGPADAFGLLDVVIRAADVLPDHLHVELHRGGVRLDLHAADPVGVLVGVDVEGDQARLVGLDDLHELLQALPVLFELALLASSVS